MNQNANEAGKLPEATSGDGVNITSYCQQVCGGGECGTGPVCKYEIDPLTEMPAFGNHLGVAQEGLEISIAEHAGQMLATVQTPESKTVPQASLLATQSALSDAMQTVDTLRRALEIIAVGDATNAKTVAEAALQESGIWEKP